MGSVPDPETQVHDFNPGTEQSGLFWTTVLSGDSVQVDLDAGTATLQVDDLAQKDFHDFENAILRDGPTPRMGQVSFKVQWNVGAGVEQFDRPDLKFRGGFRLGELGAQMEWSGRVGDFTFQSGPLAESASVLAAIGSESNGSYY